ADDVALTGRFFSAEEAAEAGMVTELVEPGEELAAAGKRAEEILANPPLAVRLIVRARRQHLEEVDRRWTAFAQPYRLHLTKDFERSARAFVDKVAANYTGD